MKTPAKKSKPVSKAPAKGASSVKSKPAAKPASKSASKTAAKKVAAKPVAKSVAKPAVKSKTTPQKPVAKKAAPAKQASKKTVKSVVKPKATPAKKAVKPPVKSSVKLPPKTSVQPKTKAAIKVASKPAVKPVAKAPVKAVAKPVAKAPAKTPIKAPGKTAAPATAKPSTKPPVKASTPSVTLPAKPLPKAAAFAAQPKPAVPPAAPVKTKAGSRVVPSYAPSPSNMSPHGGNTAAKASFTMSAPVLAPPPQVVIKKDAKLANNWKTKSADQLSDAEVIAMPDGEYMNAKQLAFFRLKLVALKNGILSNAGETTEHLREDTSVVPDPADRATIEEEHALELRTRDRERKLLKKIEQSIASIDAEEYGYCDETGEPIGVARLIARPTATLSLEAQQRRELKQKMFGD